MISLLIASLITLWSANLLATQNTAVTNPDSLFLNVIIPDADTIAISGNRQRIAANTHPDARAFIDGEEVRVHPNGAFVGLIYPEFGLGEKRITVISAMGDTLHQDLLFHRSRPDSTLPSEPLVISRQNMLPSQNLWMDEGEVLEVRFRGSPGHRASFSIEGVVSGKEMIELSPSEANGLGGVYVGRYKIRPDDHAVDVPVEFHLRKSLFVRKSVKSESTVSITPGDFPRVVETRGRRPYLNVGSGTDRLGGAKLGYIDEGIRLQVTGQAGNQYRVRLSESMTAWLPVHLGRLLPPSTPKPEALIGSISATGGLTNDVVTISLDQRLPYVSRQLLNPARIELDIFGASSNTNWITHHLGAQGVENISWEQLEDGRYRLTIHLDSEHHWGYKIGYGIGSTLRIRINRPPVLHADNVLNGLRIFIDPGHGGSNRGALGATGTEEKEITLIVSKMVESLLQDRGAEVIMTRRDDRNIPMHERVDMIKSSGAQVLVSIHANSIGGATNPEAVKGTSTYFNHIGFRPLADIMYESMLELGFRQFGVIGSFNFSLNALTEMPNVLVETGFISHPEEEMNLLDPEFQYRMAEKIVAGLERFFRTHGVIPDVPHLEAGG